MIKRSVSSYWCAPLIILIIVLHHHRLTISYSISISHIPRPILPHDNGIVRRIRPRGIETLTRKVGWCKAHVGSNCFRQTLTCLRCSHCSSGRNNAIKTMDLIVSIDTEYTRRVRCLVCISGIRSL